MNHNGNHTINVGNQELALSGNVDANWYVGWCPQNEIHCAEGSWEQWVRLAHAILRENDLRKFNAWQSAPVKGFES